MEVQVGPQRGGVGHRGDDRRDDPAFVDVVERLEAGIAGEEIPGVFGKFVGQDVRVVVVVVRHVLDQGNPVIDPGLDPPADLRGGDRSLEFQLLFGRPFQGLPQQEDREGTQNQDDRRHDPECGHPFENRRRSLRPGFRGHSRLLGPNVHCVVSGAS